jgi:hypothetical protein
MVAVWTPDPGVSDRTPRAAPRIDRTGAELSPLPGGVRRFQRLDAVAGAGADFQRAIMDVDQAAQAMRDEEILAEIEDFIEGVSQPTYRGKRINGQRVATWSSRDGWSGDTRPDADWLQ